MEKIVQGIDVKDCEYIYTDRDNDLCCAASIGGDSLCDPAQMMCNKYLDHIRKQLQAKEQEIKEIKKYLGISSETIMQRLEELQERRDELSEENEKLKNCLTEIKRITEKHKVTAHCDYLIDMDKILQTIREVEDENS